MTQHVTEQSKQTLHVTLNMVVQIVLVLAVVAVVTWAVLFTNYPPVHDFFHELRHSLFVIPCH